jgi:hypothetical protein
MAFRIHALLEEPSNKRNANSRARAQHPSQSDSNAIIADLDERGAKTVIAQHLTWLTR